MAEVKAKIPDELEPGLKQLSEEEVDSLVSNALKERLSERLMFKITDELLKGSEITDELALKWGRELKERAARKR